MSRRHFDNVLAKLILRLDQRVELYLTTLSFDSRSYSRLSFTIVDILKFFDVKLPDESIISINDDTRDKIYLNVKLLEDLISLSSDRIDEILATVRHFVVEIDYFFEDMRLSKIEKVRQIQLECLKKAKRAQNAIERVIRAIRRIAQRVQTDLSSRISSLSI